MALSRPTIHSHLAPRPAALCRCVAASSSWSLTEVVTTEATVNAHAYLVTFFFGPAAFAPVAASALIIRPIGVVMNAVTDFERPDLARQIDDSRLGGVMRSIRAFRVVLIAAWVATAIAAAGLMTYAPGLIFPSHYHSAYLAIGAALWMAVAGIRLLRTPEGTLLQAAGAFRSLAYASIGSSVVSVAPSPFFSPRADQCGRSWEYFSARP